MQINKTLNKYVLQPQTNVFWLVLYQYLSPK